MATSPALLNPATIELHRPHIELRRPHIELPAVSKVWIPVLFSLIFICFTSTTLMSGYHTQFVVNDLWKALFGNWHLNDWAGVVNGEGRKVGHVFGYGAVGLIFRHAWQQTLSTRAVRLGHTVVNSRLMALSAVLSVLSIAVVASADELHQCFLPQRVGSFGDVLRDTFGAIFLNLVLLAYRAYKRPAAAYVWDSPDYSAE
jgi:VanZ family protein